LSNDKELVKAVEAELSSISSTLEKKITEYMSLYDQSFKATLESSGSNIYKNLTLLRFKKQYIDRGLLWLD